MDKAIIREIRNTVYNYLKKRNIKLNQLVLFGSYAEGNYTPESDIDLIIVSESFRNTKYSDRIKNSLGINRTLVKKTNLPVDLLYYSDEEWNNSETLMIREARKNGKVIYS